MTRQLHYLFLLLAFAAVPAMDVVASDAGRQAAPAFAEVQAASAATGRRTREAGGRPANEEGYILAILGLVVSLLGLLFVPILGSIAGIVLSVLALRKLRENPGTPGRSMAVAGLALGVAGLVIWGALLGLYIWILLTL
ncbi:MAG: hypothetical protein OHK0039_04680 [Bacteroidia bacterium]